MLHDDKYTSSLLESDDHNDNTHVVISRDVHFVYDNTHFTPSYINMNTEISSNFTIRIKFASKHDNIELYKLGKLAFEKGTYMGIIYDIRVKAIHTAYEYDLTLVSEFFFFTQNIDYNIFQKQSLQSIIEHICQSKVKIEIEFEEIICEYIVQYAETGFYFLNRLCGMYGISYFFTFEPEHTIVHFVKTLHTMGASVVLVNSTVLQQKNRIVQISKLQKFCPKSTTLIGYNHRNVDMQLCVTKETDNNSVQDIMYSEIVNLNANDTTFIDNFAEIVSGHKQCLSNVLELIVNVRSIYTGMFVELQNTNQWDGKYYVIKSELIMTDSYLVKIWIIKEDIKWYPEQYPTKSIYGCQTATVVADQDIPSGIYAEQGCVKVKFHWKNVLPISKWIRTTCLNASQFTSSAFIPRIGDEVVVIFQSGDPSRPLIIGSAHNSRNEMLFEAHEAGMQFRVLEPDLQNAQVGENLLKFKNLQNEAAIELSAQDKLQLISKGILETNVEKDSTTTIKGNVNMSVEEGNKSCEIQQGNNILKINTGEYTIEIAKGKLTITAQSEINIKSSTSISLTGQQVTINGSNLKMIGDTIDISASGNVSVKGMMINLN